MIIYPDENYDSWISDDDANEYFETRLYVDEWDAANKEAALQTAFRSLNELDLDIDLDEDDTPVEALMQAQCEQALHEVKHNFDSQIVQGVGLGGLLSVKFTQNKNYPRYSQRALSILRPYLLAKTISRTR